MGLLKKLAIYTTSNGFTNDALGNVVTKQTANLKKEGKTINYEYDYGRLTAINYPDHPENNVKYHYGGINSSYNRIGRLMFREDGSGAIITNLDGEVSQHIEYVPFGEVFIEERNNTWNTPYLFNAKEFDEETGMYYYGARYYEPKLSLWMSVDPLEEKYYNSSSYAYCNNNPIRFIDPDGRIVIASDENAKRNIINTLSDAEAKYVQFDKNGVLNHRLLSKYEGSSDNFSALKTLLESSTNYLFNVSDKDINGKAFFEKGTNRDYPNNYLYGITNLPNAENDPSPDENVYIFTASFLDERTQARNTAHEGYGHAYFYELSKKDPSINPNHTLGKIGIQKEYDSELKMEIEFPVFGKTNIRLERQISTVEQQALKNYDEKNN